MDWLERTELLLGSGKLEKLKRANVLIVGLGGVGAIAAEMICRAGVGKMTIVDGDVVDISNRNRQLPALVSTSGLPKTHILENRFRDINPDINLTILNEYIRDERTEELLDSQQFDYVVDAIDTLSPKVFLIHSSLKRNISIISSMGAGGKIDPSKVQVADISRSYNCKLARLTRKRLSRMGIYKGIKVVFSSELVNENSVRQEQAANKKSTVGTISYMPAVFGCYIASSTINGIIDS